ncbi:hypothetical protein QGP82_21415 [Leptothoe sp. LEGE 181152]|nr:hypothetical protein [Leptothoe sp. LEGE 181152]
MNKTNSKSKQEIEKELANFSGTTQYYRHSAELFPLFFLTDGAYYAAESCGAYWLMDYIASHQTNPVIRDHPKLQQLQFWELKVKGSKGIVICEWDSGFEVFREEIQFTDFPLDSIRIWVAPFYLGYAGYSDIQGKEWGWVAYLPSEH